jgi:ATP-binding cassette, subfamily F, member 3
MIRVENLCLDFGTQKVFNNISFLLNGNEKIGLVGLNGTGKSTLLKIIAGQQEPDKGIVQKSGHKKIGYMPQEVVLISTRSVVEEIMHSIEIYDETQVESMRAEAKRILMGLGFSTSQLEQPVNDLSVGWRMRVILAQLLMQKADFYLFDEPTNHLDIVTKQWFLNFLKQAKFGFMLVCHERYFLDNVCQSILELEHGNGTQYKGNYSSYLAQKEQRKQALQAAYTQQQKEITQKQMIIDKFKAGTRSTAAKSMQKQLNKIERIELPPDIKKVDFKLPQVEQPGRTVVTVNNVAHAFEDKKIFNNVTFEIERNEKVAIIAANGVGKTTLLNIIMGKYKLQHGKINLGHNVNPAFFEQDQVSALNPEKTIFETMQEGAPKVTDLVIRNMLGSFLFTKDLINKKTKVLSGGERNRLSMAKVLLQKANFLILDEPTNHLDIPSKEILLDALKQYQGTILFVSHDQEFINELATHIIELTPSGAFKYTGNYNDYLNHKQFIENQEKETNKANSNSVKDKPKQNNFEQKKEIRRLENQIEKTEKEIAQLSKELENYQYGSPQFNERYERIGELNKKYKLLMADWEKLV